MLYASVTGPKTEPGFNVIEQRVTTNLDFICCLPYSACGSIELKSGAFAFEPFGSCKGMLSIDVSNIMEADGITFKGHGGPYILCILLISLTKDRSWYVSKNMYSDR